MSKRFSIFTKILAVLLFFAVCAAIVPSQVFSAECESERKAAEKATEDAAWACAFSITGCAVTGGWACVLAAAYCLRKMNQASDAWGDYWECQAAGV